MATSVGINREDNRFKRRLDRVLPGLQPLTIGCSRDLRITGVSKHQSVWMYHVEVLDSRPSLLQHSLSVGHREFLDPKAFPIDPAMPVVVRYSIMRRYNEFRDLYETLLESHGQELMEALPSFPDNGIWSFLRSDNHKFLQYRKEQLQTFLRALDEHPDTKWCRVLLQFLLPNKRDLMDSSRVNQCPANSMDSPGWNREVSPNGMEGGGYVSLSSVRSPQIRFRKDRHDSKRAFGAQQRYNSWPTTRNQQLTTSTSSSSSAELQRLLSMEAP